MSDTPTWIVTTSNERPIKDVVRELRATGFEVGEVLGEIGIITGRSAQRHVAALRRIKGVSDISPDQPVDIGPPDAEIS